MKCNNCHGDFKEVFFYNGIKNMCKQCVVKVSNYQNKMMFIDFCNKYDIPFIGNLYNNQSDIAKYFKYIFSLSQYRGIGFKGSEFYSIYDKSENSEKLIHEEIIETLEEECRLVMKKMKKVRNNNDLNSYKMLVNTLKEESRLLFDYKRAFNVK